MTNQIRRLDEHVANKIAAGEVVEKPAAVVKELVENAIDAGSSKITVEVKKGGKALIRVTDNGSGIEEAQIPLAFERHATSKIREIEDIYEIVTLGFRGEALASISAVSRMSLVSKTKEQETGFQYQVAGGRLVDFSPVGTPNGTTITVEDIFFNTPARQKFLKSDKAETTAVNNTVTTLALSHPEVAFEYISDNKAVFVTPGKDKLDMTVASIYDRYLAKHLIPVTVEERGISFSGFVTQLAYTRGNRQYEHFFVNGRYVKSKTLSDALSTAYKGLLPVGRFPACFLHLTIDPKLVDVNIHPQKTEIKFQADGEVKQTIYEVVRGVLNSFNQVPKVTLTQRATIRAIEGKAESRSSYEQHRVVASSKEKGQESTSFKRDTQPRENIVQEKPLKESSHQEKPVLYPGRIIDVPAVEEEAIDFEAFEIPETELVEPEVEPLLFQAESLLAEESVYDKLHIIGQLFSTYLLAQADDKMYLIDQHAAHEKVLYEQFLDEYHRRTIEWQGLLMPLQADVGKNELPLVMKHQSFFEQLGFSIDEFGDQTIVIRHIPSMLTQSQSLALFHEVKERLMNQTDDQLEHGLEAVIQQSCKKAIKAHDALSLDAMLHLIDQLKQLKDPYTCPHGRPIMIEISKQELEKKFKRT